MAFTRDGFTGKRFGRYEVVCRLAVGGSAEIFLGVARTGPFVGLPLIIKRMLSGRDDPRALEDLIAEAKLLASFHDPNIARIYDIAVTEKDIALVMEFIPGATLSEVRRACKRRGERLPLGFIVKVVTDALVGLHHAHEHRDPKGRLRAVVHGDVTPTNLMLDFKGTTRLLDFGIARYVGSRKSRDRRVRGTAAYMSPEQIRGQPIDARSDVFAVGAVLHELLTGEVAFGRKSDKEEINAILDGQILPPQMRVPTLPAWVDAVTMRALDALPARRFQDAMAFHDKLLERAKGQTWTAHQCAEFLRRDFAPREGRIEELMEEEIELHDGPTHPTEWKGLESETVEVLDPVLARNLRPKR
jgi:serine/threonine protein kinase